MKQLFDYTLLRWKTFIIYGVTKVCTPKGKPKIVKSRQFKIFDTNSFHADLSLAPWHLQFIWKEIQIVPGKCDFHAPKRKRKVRNYYAPWLTPKLKSLKLLTTGT